MISKRWFDIEFTDKFKELDTTSEFATTHIKALAQATQHLAGTGYRSIDKITVRKI